MTKVHDMQPYFDTHPDTGAKMVAGYACACCDIEAGHPHGHVNYLKTQPCQPPPPPASTRFWNGVKEIFQALPVAAGVLMVAFLVMAVIYTLLNVEKIEAEVLASDIADCKVLLERHDAH